MQKLKAGLKALGKFPLVLLFFAFLFIFSLIDTVKPAQEMSELENRKLTQAPPFTMTSFLSNKWTQGYGEFVRDQFLLRDGWVSMHSGLEAAQGKIEAGGVWLAEDGYQIAKNDVLSPDQQRLLPLNTQAVGELAARHPGMVQVMIVPSPASILSAKLVAGPPQIDEDGLTGTILAGVAAEGAGVIDLRPAFRQAAAEDSQIYYRTDHHWTTDGGARLAYEAFCEAAGREVLSPDGPLVLIPNFLGTNFAKTVRPFTRADTLAYYDLPNPMTITRLQADGSTTTETTGIMDTAKLGTFDKYAAFLHGNNGYSVIEGNGEGSILVVKDSYGNSFVPYLVQNYAKIGVMDLRAWLDPIDATIAEEGYEEILVLYSFASFSEDAYVTRLATEKQG